jgi:hypothetical protein
MFEYDSEPSKRNETPEAFGKIASATQIELLCRQTKELKDSGGRENHYLIPLENFVDEYARIYHAVRPGVYHADKIELWSVAARAARAADTATPVRIEHGTPRRELARLVYTLWGAGKFSKAALDSLIATHWQLAVITLDEDKRLNRSKMFPTPLARWADATIELETRGNKITP